MARRVSPQGKFSPQNYYRTPLSSETKPSREERRVVEGVRRRRLGRLSRLLLGLMLITGLWYFGTVSGTQIESNTGETAKLEAELASRLNGWRMFKPLVNPGRLAEDIKRSDGSIAELKLSWSLGSRQLHAAVVYRQAVARAAEGSRSLGLIGQDGVFYTGSDSGRLPAIEDTGGVVPTEGQPFVPIRSLDFIRLVEQSISQLPQDIQASRRYLLVESSREIHLASRRPFIVKLNIERPAADQVQELAEALAFLKKAGRTPAEYVDLRIDDTAYYR
jgi:hypothetical protein